MRHRLIAALAVASVSLGLLGAAAPAHAAPDVRTAGGLLDWIGAHPGRAGIAVVRSGGRSLLSQSAQRRFPLASTRKVLIVGAYAEAVAAGTLDPAQPVALADVERYYLPGTDGGAHPAAVEEWAARGTVTGAPGAEVVPLDELARAAIVQSDNAAADYLLVRLGAETVTAFAASNRMARQDPPAPLLGEYLAWTQRTPAAWAALTPAQRARQAFRLAAAGEPATSFPGVARQRRFVRSSVAGTPADWARLMARIGRGQGLSPAAAAVLRRHLEWQREFPKVAATFSRLGDKGGSLPGSVTEAAHVTAKGRPGIAVAVFLRELPPRIERSVPKSASTQRLILRLTADPAFLARARRSLG